MAKGLGIVHVAFRRRLLLFDAGHTANHHCRVSARVAGPTFDRFRTLLLGHLQSRFLDCQQSENSETVLKNRRFCEKPDAGQLPNHNSEPRLR